MTILHFIEGIMVLAFIFYVIAYRKAIKKDKKHKWFAITGFSIDMFGTFLMYYFLREGDMFIGVFLPDIHTLLSLIAIACFIFMMFLGIIKKTYYHKKFAQWCFFPIWGISFLSGGFMIH